LWNVNWTGVHAGFEYQWLKGWGSTPLRSACTENVTQVYESTTMERKPDRVRSPLLTGERRKAWFSSNLLSAYGRSTRQANWHPFEAGWHPQGCGDRVVGLPLMKAYGTITTHCWIKGHGTHCEVAEEMSLNADSRTTIKRKWRREVEKELVQDSASSPKP
jgi:hypothetical protein